MQTHCAGECLAFGRRLKRFNGAERDRFAATGLRANRPLWANPIPRIAVSWVRRCPVVPRDQIYLCTPQRVDIALQ